MIVIDKERLNHFVKMVAILAYAAESTTQDLKDIFVDYIDNGILKEVEDGNDD